MTIRNDIKHARIEKYGGGIGWVWRGVGGCVGGHTSVHVMRVVTHVHRHTHTSCRSAFIHFTCKCHAGALHTLMSAEPLDAQKCTHAHVREGQFTKRTQRHL